MYDASPVSGTTEEDPIGDVKQHVAFVQDKHRTTVLYKSSTSNFMLVTANNERNWVRTLIRRSQRISYSWHIHICAVTPKQLWPNFVAVRSEYAMNTLHIYHNHVTRLTRISPSKFTHTEICYVHRRLLCKNSPQGFDQLLILLLFTYSSHEEYLWQSRK